MCKVLKIPKRLLESRQEILIGFSNAPGTDYDKDWWQIYLEGNSDLEKISLRFPNCIRRYDIELLSREAASGGYPEVRRLFLACMIWGWGNRGRGMQNTADMLAFEGLETLLMKTVSLVGIGRVVEAYNRSHLPYCGPAFFTKFFYFIGLGTKTNPLPLILDARVAKSLEMLGKEEGWDLSIFSQMNKNKDYIRRYPEGYRRYVESMDKWARELACRADAIEYFLFRLAKVVVVD